MKKFSIIAGILALVVLLPALLFPAVIWDGSVNIEFRFHVFESGSKRPVADAKIRVLHRSDLQYLSDTNFAVIFPAVSTDIGGLASLNVSCGAGGSDGFFGKRGRFVISHELLIEAAGYRPLSNALANVAGGRRFPISKRVLDVELFLSKNP